MTERTLAAQVDALLPQRGEKPLDPAYGTQKRRAVALIDEARCIGCTLCIQACPVDAIVGAAKYMHTVIAMSCTGCELCVPPCPVDCIAMLPLPEAQASWTPAMADAARARFRFRNLRIAREEADRAEGIARKAQEERVLPDAKRAMIHAAMERAKVRRAGITPRNPNDPAPQVEATNAAIDARRMAVKKP